MQLDKPLKLLIVDDEQANLEILTEYLEDEECRVISVSGGEEAWEIVQKEKDFDVIVLDRLMPGMDGMELLKKIKANDNLKEIPVVMQTAARSSEQIVEGMNAGVYYYLTKPYTREMLVSVVKSAFADSVQKKKITGEVRGQRSSVTLLREAVFEFSTVEEAHNLACLLAHCYPDSEKAVIGLSELMMNAVEHGNLGVGYDRKGTLVREGMWVQELKKRLLSSENQQKIVRIKFKNLSDRLVISIRDSGKGFDWKQFMEISTDRATAPNGRGILISRVVSFDEVNYKGNGNEVECVVYKDKG